MNGRSGPKAAPVIAAAKQDPGHRTARDIQKMVTDATIDELVQAWPAYLIEGFRCPRCSRRRGLGLREVSASVLDDVTWVCNGRYIASTYSVPTRRVACRGGTLWSLRRLLLDDREALERFLEVRDERWAA